MNIGDVLTAVATLLASWLDFEDSVAGTHLNEMESVSIGLWQRAKTGLVWRPPITIAVTIYHHNWPEVIFSDSANKDPEILDSQEPDRGVLAVVKDQILLPGHNERCSKFVSPVYGGYRGRLYADTIDWS